MTDTRRKVIEIVTAVYDRESQIDEAADEIIDLVKSADLSGDATARAALAEAHKEIERLREDAERYRWLRDPKTGDASPLLSCYCGDSLDSAIDAAMAAEQSDERSEE